MITVVIQLDQPPNYNKEATTEDRSSHSANQPPKEVASDDHSSQSADQPPNDNKEAILMIAVVIWLINYTKKQLLMIIIVIQLINHQ